MSQPGPKFSSMRWIAAAGFAGTLGLVLAIAALVIVNREYSEDRDSLRGQLVAANVQIDDLEDKQVEATARATCRSRYSVIVTDEQVEMLAFFGELLADDVADEEAIKETARKLRDALLEAKDARVGYEADPVLPCPIDA
jgi:hypothetical protein